MKTKFRLTHPCRIRWWLAALLGFSGILGAVPQAGPQEKAGADADAAFEADVASCKKSLNMIYEAIMEYRRVHKRLPNYLSDLNPDFITETRLFICPQVQRRGDFQTWRQGIAGDVFLDPILPTTYAYEFCVKKYKLWAGQSTTVQEYKMRQMQLVGSNVPILRCLAHQPYVNVSFGGMVFASGTDWETRFADIVSPEKLLPPEVFKDLAPLPGRYTNGISPREPGTDPAWIDLTRFYVAGIRTPWLWRNPTGKDLGALPQGTVRLPVAPVAFDIRGVIQLYGSRAIAPFPVRVDGIPVGRRCHVLHFLQGAGHRGDPPGTQVGQYDVHYADGTRAEIPILYGRDVSLAWDSAGATNAPGARVAWEESLPVRDESVGRARVFHQAWNNPKQAIPITSIDFVSAVTRAAPFLIAISLEP